MAPLRYFVVDAFAPRPFMGNPAAVVPLDAWPNDEWLQNVAMELNLSETAYFVRQDSQFHLRWFTPKVEVELCGHATLATAKIIDHLGLATGQPQIEFTTRSGVLTARAERMEIWLDFPLKPEQPATA